MSYPVVPCSVPLRVLMAIVTATVAARPTVESFPEASRVLTTGCVVNVLPAVAPLGGIANANTVADPGLIVIDELAALVTRLSPLVRDAVRVMDSAFVYLTADS